MVASIHVQTRPTSPAPLAFIGAAAATAVAGAVLMFGLQPTTDVSDEMWRYPWSSSGAFVTVAGCGTPKRSTSTRVPGAAAATGR